MMKKDWGDKVLTEGNKFDQGKVRFGLMPVSPLREIARVFTNGANKYADRNWELGIKFERVYSALQRHLNAWWEREDNDSEWGLSHLAHAGCCLLFLLYYSINYKIYAKFDDRPVIEDKE